ncbi:DUF1775 domain-containing protein [Carbonactinospora thermoautotrophica]|uniref:DUF1775 domain-containing protein n=1 Tax=Carbonactinospora thermoautotrophica TaxID=1469144 RepID=UPI00099E6D2E
MCVSSHACDDTHTRRARSRRARLVVGCSRYGHPLRSFRVPNERPNASTIKLEVLFPAEQPLASVSVKPHPGWKHTVEKAKLAKPIEAHGNRAKSPLVRAVNGTVPAQTTCATSANVMRFYALSCGRSAETLRRFRRP